MKSQSLKIPKIYFKFSDKKKEIITKITPETDRKEIKLYKDG